MKFGADLYGKRQEGGPKAAGRKGELRCHVECEQPSPANSFGSRDQKGKSSSVLEERWPMAEGGGIFPSLGKGNQCQLEYWSLVCSEASTHSALFPARNYDYGVQ